MTEAGQATPESDLRDRIMNSNVAKSEAEWWAAREIKDLLATIARLEAEKVKDGEALEPFSEVLADVGDDEDDEDLYAPMNAAYRRAPAISVGHLRAARARLSSRAKDQSQ